MYRLMRFWDLMIFYGKCNYTVMKESHRVVYVMILCFLWCLWSRLWCLWWCLWCDLMIFMILWCIYVLVVYFISDFGSKIIPRVQCNSTVSGVRGPWHAICAQVSHVFYVYIDTFLTRDYGIKQPSRGSTKEIQWHISLYFFGAVFSLLGLYLFVLISPGL